MPFLVADTAQRKIMDWFSIDVNFFLIIGAGLLCLWLTGIYDSKFLLGHEQGYMFEKNTEWKKHFGGKNDKPNN